MSVIVALLGAVLALGVALALGGAVLYRARLGHGPVDLLVRALLGLALLAAVHVHVAVGLTLASLIAAATWRGHNLEDAVLDDARKPSAIALGAIAVAAIVALLRPASPIFASDDALLSLARAISQHAHLPATDRSLVFPVATSALALGSAETASLSVGGSVFVIASFALFVLLVARSVESRFDEALPIIVVACVPFAWVHLRGVSAELAAGCLAASFALALARAGEGDRVGPAAAFASALLLGMVDEGFVLVVAVVLGFELARTGRAAQRTSFFALMLLALATMAERWGAPSAPLTDVDTSAAGSLAIEGVRHATDLQTWGLVPAVAVAAVIASLRPSVPRTQRALAYASVLAPAMMLVVLVLAPVALRERALDGALFNRLGLELLPLGAVLIAGALRARS